MKLRNKKTGMIQDVNFVLITDVRKKDGAFVFRSIEQLNEEYEDYKSAEPLIKDEKVRKAVRAWAEMNDIRFIHMCSRIRKENARVVGQNALGRSFTMEISNEYEIRVRFKDYKMFYTVAELCGEEEE